ncbi:MAG TPA: hypothetical protein VFQ96_07985 [Microbacteriaceae bacterium]|nr:hypothetical protein [Microbacteriaceae bacterium]
MEKLVLASTGADADAVVAIERRHTELGTAAAMKTLHVLNMVPRPYDVVRAARDDLVWWAYSRLQPYLEREADLFFPALPSSSEADDAARDARYRLTEIAAAVTRLRTDDTAHDIAADAIALRSHLTAFFETQQHRILPYLAFSRRPIHELWQLVNT